jgi:hypothetical protein
VSDCPASCGDRCFGDDERIHGDGGCVEGRAVDRSAEGDRAGLGGFVLGLEIMFVDDRHSVLSDTFVDTTSGWVWMIFIAAQVAFWAVVAVPLWSGLRRMHRRYARQLEGVRIRSVLFGGLFLALPVAALFVGGHLNGLSDPLYNHRRKIGLVSALSWGTVVMPALTGMFWVYTAADRVSHEDPGDIDRFTDLRDNLQRLLKLLGAVIALSTLSTGALLQAMVDNAPTPVRLPSELVLLWGGGATVLIMAAYVPAYLKVQGWGQTLVRRLVPEPAPDPVTGSSGTRGGRPSAPTSRSMRVYSIGCKSGVFVLAPLLAAAVSVDVPR